MQMDSIDEQKFILLPFELVALVPIQEGDQTDFSERLMVSVVY